MYKAFWENRIKNGQNNKVRRGVLKIAKATVNIHGSRAADECDMTVMGRYDISLNDIITFICDDVDVDDLKAAWNFYYSLRDEAGYNIDLHNVDSNGAVITTQPTYGVETSASSRFLGQRCLDCTTTQHYLRAVQNDTEGNKVIDFNRDCDIFIQIQVPSSVSGEQVIFSRSDGSNGVEVGLNNDGSNIYAYVRANGGTASSYNSNVSLGTGGGDAMIRVYKSSGTTMTCKVNSNIADPAANTGQNATFSGNLDNNLTNIFVGCDHATTAAKRFTGKIYSIKVYDKNLNDSDASVVYKRLAPSTTMKFGGTVSQLVDRGNSMTINAVGYSSNLLRETELGEKDFPHHSESASKGVYKYDDTDTVSKKRTLLENIVGDVVDVKNNNIKSSDEGWYGDFYNNAQTSFDGKLGREVLWEYQFKNTNDEDDTGSTSPIVAQNASTTNDDDVHISEGSDGNTGNIDVKKAGITIVSGHSAVGETINKVGFAIKQKGTPTQGNCRFVVRAAGSGDTVEGTVKATTATFNANTLPTNYGTASVPIFTSKDLTSSCTLAVGDRIVCEYDWASDSSGEGITMMEDGSPSSDNTTIVWGYYTGVYRWVSLFASDTILYKLENVTSSGTNAYLDTDNQYHSRNLNKFSAGGNFIELLRSLVILGGKEYNSSARITAAISSGAISGFTVVNGGSGYSQSSPPSVILMGGGAPENAKATATVNNGVITSVQIVTNHAGAGYEEAPKVIVQGGLTHLNGADIFFVTPRKTLIVENSEKPDRTYYDTSRGFKIWNSEYDITGVFNDITVHGNLKIKNTATIGEVITLSSIVDGSPITNLFGAFNDKSRKIIGITVIGFSNSAQNSSHIVRRCEEGKDYTFDSDHVLTMLSGASTNFAGGIQVQVHYIDLINQGNTSGADEEDDTGSYYYQQNKVSVEKYGVRSLKYYFPSLQDITTAAAVCRRILGARAENKQSVLITIPRLSNSVNVGSKIKVTKESEQIDSEDFVVKSISYSIPDFRTTVTAGNFKFDFLDVLKDMSDSLRGITQEQIGTTEGNFSN